MIMQAALACYFLVGIIFGWNFFFRIVWRAPSIYLADFLFYILLIFIWPYPLIDKIARVIRSRRK